MHIPMYPTIQSFPWQASVEAIKDSQGFNTYDDFYDHLLNNLPINSPETRKKYSNVIQRRFFPNRTLEDLAPIVWKRYQDERIMMDIMRVIALEAEPAVAEFVVAHILSKNPGSILDQHSIREFIIDIYGEFKPDSYKRLPKICIDLGFLGRYNKSLVVESIPEPDNAFLIVFHERLAPTPRIVRLNEVFEAEWWQYLGIRRTDEIREILHRAELEGLIARSIKVDELEQVTTRYSSDEYLRQALRL